MIRQLTSKDKINFIDYCLSKNYSKDIKKLNKLYNDILKRNTKCLVFENNEFNGLIIIEKKNKKSYVTILTNSNKIAFHLIKHYIWNNEDSLYIKFSKWNYLIKLLNKLGFRIISKKGNKTIDLYRQFDKKFYFPKNKG